MFNNSKYLFIDSKMRNIEKQYLKSLNKYNIIDICKNNNLYEEISSHVDISVLKINNNIIIEPLVFENLNSNIITNKEISNYKLIIGDVTHKDKYPFDIAYNVCIIGNYAIHNFKYTSKKVLEILKKESFNLINVEQGYTNCSIAVIDDNSLIINDRGLYRVLSKYNFDILFIEEELDIKLLKNDLTYSLKKGFIGGCIARIENKVIIFGDLDKIDKNSKISNFIKNRGFEIIDFKGLDVIDYGGIVVI